MPLHLIMTLLLLAGWSLTAIGVGRICLVPLSHGFNSLAESLFFSFGVGLIAIGYGLFALGCLGALLPFYLYPFITIVILASLAGWYRPLSFPAKPSVPRHPLDRLAASFLLFLLLTAILMALTPETGKDALIYHLAVPKRYLAFGGFHFIPGNIFSGYPLLGEMHYLIALFLQGDILAKAVHFALLCGTLLGIGIFVTRHLPENPFPALTMLLFTSIPSVFLVSYSAYNDLFVALFTIAAIMAFLSWSEKGSSSWIFLAGVFTGAAVACKYTALLLPLLGGTGVLWTLRHQKGNLRHTLYPLGIYFGGTFLSGVPFYLKNWITLGNPFYPFFYEVFGGRGWDSEQARLYALFVRELGMGRDWIDYLLLPWNLSLRAQMDSPHFDGILGPLFLLTFPFLLPMRRWGISVRTILFFILATFLFWASSAQQMRYLIPQFALAAILVGVLLTYYHKRKLLFSLLLTLISVSLLFNLWHIADEVVKARPWSVVFGQESREDFLARRITPYPMYRYVNEKLPPQSRIFLIYMKNFTFLCERNCYADAMFEAHTLQKLLRQAPSTAVIKDRLTEAGFTHLLYDEYYLLGDPSPLSPQEKALFLAFREGYLENLAVYSRYRLDGIRKGPSSP